MKRLSRRTDRSHSLRWRLILAVSLVALLIWGLTGLLSYSRARQEAEELLDGHLSQHARLLLALLRDHEATIDDLAKRFAGVAASSHDVYEPPIEFQYGKSDGTILLRSANAPDLPITGTSGYSDILRRHESWRILNTASPDERYRIQVAQSIDVRDRAALEVASQTILPIGLILPILLLLLYFSIRRALRPLDQLAEDIAARRSDNLSPLPSSQIPTEARPLVAALNRLFFRVGLTIENERRFTADAAHELRTPLAALKIQAQVALLSEESQSRNHALRQIEAGVDRATHLVEQLLRLARLDPLSRLPAPQAIDLGEILRKTVAAVGAANRALSQTILIELPPTALPIVGDAGLLEIAIRNLLDNAIRYTPSDSTIWLSVEDESRSYTLTVRDNGPGVPAVELPRLSERFYRGRETDVEGSGLGLAIVARIADLHGARFVAGNHPDRGFFVTLEFLLP